MLDHVVGHFGKCPLEAVKRRTTDPCFAQDHAAGVVDKPVELFVIAVPDNREPALRLVFVRGVVHRAPVMRPIAMHEDAAGGLVLRIEDVEVHAEATRSLGLNYESRHRNRSRELSTAEVECEPGMTLLLRFADGRRNRVASWWWTCFPNVSRSLPSRRSEARWRGSFFRWTARRAGGIARS